MLYHIPFSADTLSALGLTVLASCDGC
jgi:hypothetical protein